MRRSEQRREAVFAIYQRDVTGRPLDELLTEARPFSRDLAHGVAEHQEELDVEIGANARGWTIQRIAPLERAIMRVALFEIRHREEIPVAVSIDEAVSLTGRYCGPGTRLRQRHPLGDRGADRGGAGMSADPGGSIRALDAAAERLAAIATELDDPETGDPRAVELAREAAQIAADAGANAAEASRAAAERGAERHEMRAEA